MNIAGESASEVCELIHCCEILAINCDNWFLVWSTWGWLIQYFGFLCADCKAKVVAGTQEAVNAVLHVIGTASIEGAIISK